MKRVLVSGTFDPPTMGHLSVIERCSQIFDETVVCVFVNAEKTPMFTEEERKLMIEGMCKDLHGIRVDSWSGMLAEYARENGISFVARGIRGKEDIEYEMDMAMRNKGYNPDLETIFFPAKKGQEDISSTLVRSALENCEDISALVHPFVDEMINKKGRA